MEKYYDLEINILSCLLQKPELMQRVILEDKHFIKNQRLWKFMKAFYKKFNTFDIPLMYSVCKDKFKLVMYVEWLVDVIPAPSLFQKYQEQLIELYEQTRKEKWIKEKLFELANDLYVGNIELKNYVENINYVFKNAKEIFKGENNEKNKTSME